MKKNSFVLLIALAALFTSACEKVTPEVVPTDGKVSFTATMDTPTRTQLVAGNNVEWLAGDAISIFDGTVNTEATTTGSGASATFTATLTNPGPWYALYPYSAGASISTGIITATLPAAQTAVAGTFADDLNMAVALSEGSTLALKNVLGLIKFTIGADADIVKVTLTGNNSETLAGTVDIDYNGGEPTWSINSGAATAIELTGTFVKGSTYYFAVLPQTFTNGFTLTYTNSSDVDRVESTSNEMVLGRSQIRNIGSPDIIVFADADVKAALVAHFDANGDGEISKAEAEALTYNDFENIVGTTGDNVTDLWGADLTVINTFNELKYFTHLVNTAQSNRYQLPAMFKGCTNLTSVKIPDNITHLSNYAFTDCSSLAAITLPAGLTHIYSHCFENCTALESITLPSTLTQISASGFANCTSLATVTGLGETGLTVLNNYTFQNCSSLTGIVIPYTVTAINASVFEGCTEMTSFALSSGTPVLVTIGNRAFYNCQKLNCSLFGSNVTNSLTSIGTEAFYNCKKITFGSRNFQSCASVGKKAFMNCAKVTNLTINNAAYQIIQDSTFLGCSSLVSIRVSNNLTQVRLAAFRGCTSLVHFGNTGTGNNFVLPPKVTEIRDYAFDNCESLVSMDFSNNTDSLRTIKTRAFRNCTGITSIELPATVSTMDRVFSANGKTMTLKTIKLNSVTPPTVATGRGILENWDATMLDGLSILVPAASVADYKDEVNYPMWAQYSAYITGF